MNLHTCILIGLLGSITMFMGDMFLYYDRKDYDNKNKVNSIIEIMKKLGTKRLYLGGILGPLGSFLYLLGSYHMVLASQEKFLKLAWILFLINSFGIIFGGAYHLQFGQGSLWWVFKIFKISSQVSFWIYGSWKLGSCDNDSFWLDNFSKLASLTHSLSSCYPNAPSW